MTDPPGSRWRHAAVAACLVLLTARASVAQSPLPSMPTAPDFLPRYEYHVDLAGLAYDDDRFSWDGRIGVDVDVVDYVHGRFSMIADYQVVMGNQLQPFDPNQSNYTLAGALSARVRTTTEVAAVFHHVSRHLGDRAKTRGVAMNMLAARFLRRVPLGTGALDIRAEAGRVTQRSYVDYSWIARVYLAGLRPMTPRVQAFGRASVETIGVRRAIAGRNRQNGGRLEAGARIAGRAASIELFGGYERVIDADPLDRLPRHWAFAGFRLVN